MSETKTQGISGKTREQKEFGTLMVGLGTVKVIAINPTTEEYKDLLGIELKPESKATEYIGQSKEGNTSVRVDVWVENVKSGKRDKITYFLEDKLRKNKEATKDQYINTVGVASWADRPENLPEWFAKREYREAHNGEEELYSFMRSFLGKLDLKDPDTTLELDWKKLLRGNMSTIKEQIGGGYATDFVALYTVKSVQKEGEDTKQYQAIYNKAFLPVFALRNFRLVDYDNEAVLEGLKKKNSKELKPHERWVLSVTGEHGCKDSFLLKDLKEFNPNDFLVTNDNPLANDSPEY